MAIQLKNYDPAVMAKAMLGMAVGTATISGGSATINAPTGILTSAALTTGTATAETFTLLNNHITSSSVLLATIVGGTNTGGLAALGRSIVAASGSATIEVVNADCRPAGTALNGTLKIAFHVLN